MPALEMGTITAKTTVNALIRYTFVQWFLSPSPTFLGE
jgi:hypothetical protein